MFYQWFQQLEEERRDRVINSAIESTLALLEKNNAFAMPLPKWTFIPNWNIYVEVDD